MSAFNTWAKENNVQAADIFRLEKLQEKVLKVAFRNSGLHF
jgi:hypothetical protein